MVARLLARTWIVLAMVGVGLAPGTAADVQAAQPSGISTQSGDVRFGRQEITCRVPGSGEFRVLGAILSGPQAEKLWDEAVGLTSIVAASPDGYALTTPTRAFSTGLLRGGGDVLLAGLAPDLTPRWATVIGGPAPDMPLSLTRTEDGGFAVISHSKSLFSSPMRWLKQSPLRGLLSKHSSDGQLEWAKLFAPGELSIANPVVALDRGLVIGGEVRVDGRWTGFLSLLGETGELRWGRLLGRDHEVGITWMTPDEGGGLWTVGARQIEAQPGVALREQTFQIWVARFDGKGTPAWSKSYAPKSGDSMVIAAPARSGGGLLVIREPHYDRKGDLSRFPIIELGPQGEVRWAAEYELEGDGRVTAILRSSSGGYMLFGPASPKEGQGGFFTIEIDSKGQIVSSTWIDVAGSLTTSERIATTPPDPVAAVRDSEGRFVVMGDSMSLPARLIAKAKPGQAPPAGLKEDLKAAIYLVRTAPDGQVPGCSLPLRLTARSMALDGEPFDLGARSMPSSWLQDLSRDSLDTRRLEAR